MSSYQEFIIKETVSTSSFLMKQSSMFSPLSGNAGKRKPEMELASSSDDDLEEEDEDEEPLKVFFCSRTHSQLSQFVGELQRTEFRTSLQSVSLGSRKTLCINPGEEQITEQPALLHLHIDLKSYFGCHFDHIHLPHLWITLMGRLRASKL